VRPARAGALGLGGSTPARGFYLALVAAALALGALSLLVPSTPSYDPWSWLLWGREIIHGHLTITTGGTSWKPLPMIFTIPFALAGRAAPDLWLVVARAGIVASVVLSFRLAYRLTRRVGGLFAPSPDVDAGSYAGGAANASVARSLVLAPAILAGLIAAVSLGLSASGGFISSNALGYSEALATALLLVSVDRLLDGRPRQAFAVGFFVALDRPEIWLFWGLLGLWLLWKDPGARAAVIGSAVLVLALWFVPVKLGCGQFSCSVTRAAHPRSNSLAFASNPFEAELSQAAWPTMLLRLKVVAALLVAAVVGLLLYARAARARGATAASALRTAQGRARLFTALLVIGGLAWFVVIAAMTQIGFSGNNRYLVLGSALVDIAAAVGFGWAARELAALGWRALPGGSPARKQDSRALQGTGAARGTRTLGSRAGLLGTACAALLALLFMFGPNWVGSNLISIPRTHGSLVYQAHLRQGLNRLVTRFGGPNKVLACGSVMTEGFQVPMVAWTLGVATPRIEAPPHSAAPASAGPAPNVILQTRDTRSASLLPVLASWPAVHYHYAGTSGPIHMFTHCVG
ncbi:MAG: hypothetical protein ACRDMX_07430, partial [Solirubrobacteraceae bacterium]